MRRWLIVFALAAGCGETGPADGFWRAETHTLSFGGGRYEAGDRDASGTCLEAGAFRLESDSIVLTRDSAPCANGPRAPLVLGSEQILRAELGIVYVRANPNIRLLPTPIPPP